MSRASRTRGKTAKKPQARAQSQQRKRESTAGTRRRSAAIAPSIPIEVAVCESNRISQDRARVILAELGYQVAPEQDEEAIASRLRSAPPHVVLAGLPERAALVSQCLAAGVHRPVVIAALVAPTATARARASAAGADLFAVRPHGKDSLAAALQAAEQIALLRDKVTSLRGSEERLRERLQRFGQSDL
ncbi:MAG TPA: hypothetical protein VNO33_08045, partial [Kofleriaceae bacterium]|nr:hypothetical protein [Kofleriaceae bacterium]